MKMKFSGVYKMPDGSKEYKEIIADLKQYFEIEHQDYNSGTISIIRAGKESILINIETMKVELI